MLKDQITALLEKIGQQQLMVGLNTLSLVQQEGFLRDLHHFGPDLLAAQRQTLFAPPSVFDAQPLASYDTASLDQRGEAVFAGCLLLCGGQGSRLSSSDPKALFPIRRIRTKTLLQIFCEKAAAASHKIGRALPLAIMTSPLNHDKIGDYLAQNNYFGLDIDLFSQNMLPFTNDTGNWLLEAPGKISKGPDGNGYALKLFCEHKLDEKWEKLGVRSINIVPIDNPLADPFDAELINAHEEKGADVTVKAVFRHNPEEKVGIVALKNGKIQIVEYTDLPSDSSLFTIANTGLFCMSLDFIQKAASISLPWHLARKNAPVLMGTAKGYCQETVKIWKFETYIFDLLEHSTRTNVLIYPREEIYAPLKNATGEKSLDSVQSALFLQDRKTLERITGNSLPERPFELDPVFYYPPLELASAWQGKSLPPENYIDAKLLLR